MDFIHKRQEESAHVVKVIEESHVHHDTSVDFRKWPVSDMENDCEERFGLSLVGKWQENRQVWCQDNSASKNSQPSELVCYRYHQHHKKREGQGPDMFCVATNFVIDFSKIHGEYEKGHKPPLGQQYYHFDAHSLSATCSKTSEYHENMFMPHHSLQMRSFVSDPQMDVSHLQRESTPTYLLARDEDCENSFHSSADFMNMFLVHKVLGNEVADQQVLLFDKHPDGPYKELIEKAYAPRHGVHRHQTKYGTKKVVFDKLIFHLESPAGLIFPKVSRPDPLRCYRTSLYEAYRRHVLQSFNLLNVAPPPIPTATLILRHRTAHKNTGRILENEQEVVNALKSGNMMKTNVVDMAGMTYGEQLKMVRNSNIIVGVHGAGLMFIMFAAEEAVLVEIHPSYRQDRHFRHAARMTGKLYMPMRSLQRETCHGSSDNIKVDIEEFTKTIDGAVRLARNFDDGLSECGLQCPSSILALDNRLDPFYDGHTPKGRPVNTQFPCG
eukprot:gene4587-3281_t